MIHLVLGGARSGKSSYAEKLASNSGSQVCYVATATAGDDEMRERILQHQAGRPDDWELIEEPLYLSKTIREIDSDKIVLIDCMTLWLSNWLCQQTPDSVDNWQAERRLFVEALSDFESDIIIVSNEVGSGIVPLGKLTRDFADQAGWLNQQLARLADQVSLVVAGCPISIKAMS
jgi:adenosylcobinamide kinase/adenosylcobinamide-phosphate guanylyltransferase